MTTQKTKLLATRNVGRILDKLGVAFYDRGHGDLAAACPCKQHGGDRNNTKAFGWRADIGRWICFSHHCEELYGNDVIGLVRSITGLGFKETIELLNKILTGVDTNVSTIDTPKSDPSKPHIHEPIPENNLRFLQPRPRYLIDRGFDPKVLDEYEVGLWVRPHSFMDHRVVFPVRDHEGFLVGYSGRTIRDPSFFDKHGLIYHKWCHARDFIQFPKKGEFVIGSILFNLNNAKHWIEPHKSVILVEGPLDGMKLQEVGVRNWVACLSTNFTAAHRSLLVKYGVCNIAVAFDNDDPDKYKDKQSPGVKAYEKLQRVCGDLFHIDKIELPLGKDFGDLSANEARQVIQDAKAKINFAF